MIFHHRIKPVRLPLLPFLVLVFISAILNAETPNSLKTGSVDFAESIGQGDLTDDSTIWLQDADRLMNELTSLDVRLYSLINKVGDEDSRQALIRQRCVNRKLIYDLIHARNAVFEDLDESRFPGGQDR